MMSPWGEPTRTTALRKGEVGEELGARVACMRQQGALLASPNTDSADLWNTAIGALQKLKLKGLKQQEDSGRCAKDRFNTKVQYEI